MAKFNFVPSDQVKLVMTGYDLDSMYALVEIQKRFGVEYTRSDVDRIVREGWSLEMFVRDILQRASN